MKIHGFLERWGLINCDAENEPEILNQWQGLDMSVGSKLTADLFDHQFDLESE